MARTSKPLQRKGFGISEWGLDILLTQNLSIMRR
jgi:hypothetical protein